MSAEVLQDKVFETLAGPPAGFRVAGKIKRRSISWMLGQRIPIAEVVCLAADGGTGKSTAAQDLIARVSRGALAGLPGGSDLTEPRGVVLLTVEEDPEAVVRPRLEAMGADLERVLILSDAGDGETPPLTLPSGAARLEEAARFVDAALIVVDTGPGFLDPGLKSNAEEDVRRFYRPLIRMARELRLVVLVICHLNKGSDVARHRVTGSAAWVNVPRSVLVMGPPPGSDALETPERLVAVVKANLIGGRMPEAIGLTLEAAPGDDTVAIVRWGQEQAGIRATDLTTHLNADDQGEREEAMDAIRDLLEAGPRLAKECEAALDRFSKATIRRARTALFVTRAAGTVYQEGFRGPYWWRLPTSTDGHGLSAPAVDTREHPRTSVEHGCSPTSTDVHKEASRARDTRGVEVLHEDPELTIAIVPGGSRAVLPAPSPPYPANDARVREGVA